MRFNILRNALLVGVVGAAIGASPAMAVPNPIQVAFNFVPLGTLTANTGDVTTATTITSGSPLQVGAIILNNIGLAAAAPVTLTDPTPILVGNTFTKTFTTSMGTFVEVSDCHEFCGNRQLTRHSGLGHDHRDGNYRRCDI